MTFWLSFCGRLLLHTGRTEAFAWVEIPAYLEFQWAIHWTDGVVSHWMPIPFALVNCFVPSVGDPLFIRHLHFQEMDDSGGTLGTSDIQVYPCLSVLKMRDGAWLPDHDTWPEVTWRPWSTGAHVPNREAKQSKWAVGWEWGVQRQHPSTYLSSTNALHWVCLCAHKMGMVVVVFKIVFVSNAFMYLTGWPKP